MAHHHGIGHHDAQLNANPNLETQPLTEAQAAAAAAQCVFLGSVFHEGDTICYQHSRWVCSAGAWVNQNQPC